jgi:hypothetical protein
VTEFTPTDEAPSPGVVTLEYKRQLLLQDQLDLLNHTIRHCYISFGWQKITTITIRKDPHSSKIHRVRVFHLYDADLNLRLRVKWRSLTHHSVDYSLLHPGGLPGWDAATPVFLEELQWKTSRASRRSLSRMDFDASSCFDRIIPTIASLVSAKIRFSASSMGIFLRQANTSSRRNMDYQKRHTPIAACIRSVVQLKEVQAALLSGPSSPINCIVTTRLERTAPPSLAPTHSNFKSL